MEADEVDDGNVDFSSLFVKDSNPSRQHVKQKLPTRAPVKRPQAGATPACDVTKQPKQVDKKPQSKDKKRKAVSPCEEERGGRTVKQLSVDSVRSPKKKQRVSDDFWPFEVDYNDHFETSFRAIQDMQPVLQQLCKKLKKRPSELVVYDPFFCKGGIRRHYDALGFTTLIHRNHDFYQDVASGSLPQYDILVTNPPYSGDHKERILEFCLRSSKPWALLLPNYVATKAYFGELLHDTSTPVAQRPFFLTPRVRYSYDHPEGTGHAESPFFSIWYIGLGEHTEAVHGGCRTQLDAGERPAKGGRKQAGGDGGSGGAHSGGWDVSLARSVDALRQAGAVPTARRLNPKQRMRLKQQLGTSGKE